MEAKLSGIAAHVDNDFNVVSFEKKLLQLKDSQESINSLSAWCLENRQHHKKIVTAWLNVLKKGTSTWMCNVVFIVFLFRFSQSRTAIDVVLFSERCHTVFEAEKLRFRRELEHDVAESYDAGSVRFTIIIRHVI